MAISTIGEVVRTHGTRQPDVPVLLWGDGESMTYGQLYERAQQVAAALAAEGVGSQDRVAIYDKNCPEYFELQYGAALLNAVLTPVNWRLAATRGGLHRQRRARPRCWPSGRSSCRCWTPSRAISPPSRRSW